MLKSSHNRDEDMVSQSKDNNFYSKIQVQEIADEIDKAVIIPVRFQIEVEHRIFDFKEMVDILHNTQRIVLQDCGCKSEYGNCDSPLDVCLILDDEAESALEHGKYNPREIDYDEAFSVLKRSHEAGLVHMAYIMKGEEKPGLICSCCKCCCHTLGGLLHYGIHAQILSSAHIAEDEYEKCIRCGKCVNRCMFGARSMGEGELVYDKLKCYGCGLCVSSCSTHAIKMTRRDELE